MVHMPTCKVTNWLFLWCIRQFWLNVQFFVNPDTTIVKKATDVRITDSAGINMCDWLAKTNNSTCIYSTGVLSTPALHQCSEFRVTTLANQTISGHAPCYLAKDCCTVTKKTVIGRLKCFLSLRRRQTSTTEPLVQLDLKFGTICQRTSDSKTCHTAISDSCSTFLFGLWDQSAVWIPCKLHFKNPLTRLLEFDTVGVLCRICS